MTSALISQTKRSPKRDLLVRNTGAAAINLAGWKRDAGDRSQRFSLTQLEC
jgi:hypothetical protein